MTILPRRGLAGVIALFFAVQLQIAVAQVFVPPAPPLPYYAIPDFFCSQAEKIWLLNQLRADGWILSQYINLLWGLMDASNKTLKSNLVAADPALIRAYRDALHEHQSIDRDYEKAAKTPVKDCTDRPR
jgi:hypothetical protein